MAHPQSTVSREACLALDAADPLAHMAERFSLPEGVIYLDGNSLGAQPTRALERAQEVITHEWGTDLIKSWNTHGWFDLPMRIGKKISSILGGAGGACVATDTTSINIFKAVSAAVQMQEAVAPERKVIISERDNFPTDLYMIEGFTRLIDRGYELRLVDESNPLSTMLDADTAVVLLSHVNYRTGAMWDLAQTTTAVHEAGGLVVWDLCHSAGAVPVDLTAANVDFAVGCTYKYLNGGPGSPAFIWVADRHIRDSQQPLTGWWGHQRPFEMSHRYEAADDIRKFLSGTQPIVSLAMMEVGIDVHTEVDMSVVREKSLGLTNLFMDLIEERLSHHPLTLVTPIDPTVRGSHVSVQHPEGYAVMQALIDRGVIGDYREPEVLRFGFTPLYTRYVDVWDAVEVLRDILDTESWRAPEFHERGAVT